LLAPLLPVVGHYQMADYVHCQTEDFVWNTDWKLLTENFMEGYHLPVAHRKTVGAWFPAEETGFPEERHEAFTYQTFIKDQTAKYGLAHPSNTVLTGRWRSTSMMPTVFPTHMYVLAPDHLWYLSLRPKSLGEVHLRFGYALAPEVYASVEDKDAFIAETNAFFDRVNDEDRMVTEGIYQGSRAPLAKGGRLSWLEREIHDFMQYLVRRLDTGEQQRPKLSVARQAATRTILTAIRRSARLPADASSLWIKNHGPLGRYCGPASPGRAVGHHGAHHLASPEDLGPAVPRGVALPGRRPCLASGLAVDAPRLGKPRATCCALADGIAGRGRNRRLCRAVHLRRGALQSGDRRDPYGSRACGRSGHRSACLRATAQSDDASRAAPGGLRLRRRDR
jgi:hypothetical protein